MPPMQNKPPAMHRLLNAPSLAPYPRDILKSLATNLLAKHHQEPFAFTHFNQWVELLLERYNALMSPPLKPIYNATGVLLSTNLGRAVLDLKALKELSLLSGYVNLEVDLHTGKRANRCSQVQELLKVIFQAQDALVLNNNASALVLIASVFAPKSNQTLLSFGELVEIGGGFRAHELLESVTNLKLVGSTNKTYLSDYKHALSTSSTLITRIHRSNFSMNGFVASASSKDLFKLAQERDVIFYEDLGSMQSIEEVQKALRSAHLLSFSADKLLGSVQGGIVLGHQEYIQALRAHPLYRAFRVDKTQLFLLVKSLQGLICGQKTPTQEFLEQDKDTLLNKALKLFHALTPLKPLKCVIIPTKALIGGGVEHQEIESFGVQLALKSCSVESLYKALHLQGVAGILHHNGVILDVYALFDQDIPHLARVIGKTLDRVVLN